MYNNVCGVMMVNIVIESIHKRVVCLSIDMIRNRDVSFVACVRVETPSHPFALPCSCGYKILESVFRVTAFRMKSRDTCTIGREAWGRMCRSIS